MNINTCAIYVVAILTTLFFSDNLQSQTSPGRSLDFDGQDDYINILSTLPFTDEWTFEAWINWEGTGNFQRIFDYGSGIDKYMMITPQSNLGYPRFVIRTDGSSNQVVVNSDEQLQTGWRHIAVTITGIGGGNYQYTLYIDGIIKGQETGTFKASDFNNSSNKWLGRSHFSEDSTFNGKMDEVRIWNLARTQQEIIDWKDCELSGSEDGLYAYYQMNNGIAEGNNLNVDYLTNKGKLAQFDAAFENFALSGSDGNWISDTGLTNDPNSQNCVDFQLVGNDYVELDNEADFDFANEFTIEFWAFQNKSLSNTQRIITKGQVDDNSKNTNFFAEVRSGNVLVVGMRDANRSISKLEIAGVIQPNEWQHIAISAIATSVGSNIFCYVDGQLRGSGFFTNIEDNLPTNNVKVRIGESYDGKLSNIRFWNKRRSEVEIQRDLSSTLFNNTEGLVSQYVDFTNTAQSIPDITGGNTGKLEGSPVLTSDPCLVLFKEQPEDITLAALGDGFTLNAEIYNCTDKNFQYQWTKNGTPIPGANSIEYAVINSSLNDLGIYVLEIETCGGRIIKSPPAIVSSNNQGETLKFDGEDDYMTWETDFDPSFTTIETWVRFQGDPANQSIVVLTDDTGLDNYYTHHLRVNKDRFFEFSAFDSNPTQKHFTVKHNSIKPQPNQWYHVAGRISTELIEIKVDGVDGESLNEIISQPNGKRFFVGHPACGHDYFKGEIDELRIWNDANYTFNEQTIDPSEFSMMAHYFQFNEGIAGGDNTAPTPTNTATDLANSGKSADLINFDLIGTESNWLACGPFGTEASFLFQTAFSFVKSGDDLELLALLTGSTETTKYQWYKDGKILPGATSSSLTIPNAQPEDAGIYYSVAEGLNGCRSFSDPIEVLVKGTGEVLNFDGENDFLEIKNVIPLSEYTMECWVKFEGDVSNQNIIVATDDGGPFGFITNQIYTNESGFFAHYSVDEGAGIERTIVADVAAISDQWYHVAVRASNSNNMQLLIDGIVQTDTEAYNSSSSAITSYYVGPQGYTKTGGSPLPLQPFHGEIEEIRIWSEWKSDTEIQNMKDQEISSPGPTGLEYYFQFNQGIANGDNSSYPIDFIPNHKSLNDNPTSGDVKMYNFGLVGEDSNWSNCSPVTSAIITYDIANNAPHLGQDIIIDIVEIVGDTSNLNWQWLLEEQVIPDATDATYTKSNIDSTDLGIYKVIISDDCVPPYLDTLMTITLDNTCYSELPHTVIDLQASTQYIGCTTPSAMGCTTNPNPVSFNIDFGYCDSETTYFGGEAIYKFSVPEEQYIELDLNGQSGDLNADVDLFLFGDDCNLDECVASSTNVGLGGESLSALISAGDYYIIIDTKDTLSGGAEQFVLDIFLEKNKCFSADTIQCGDIITGTTVSDSLSLFNQYCGDEGYSGSEIIYQIEVDTSRTLIIDLDQLSVDLDLFLLDSNCVEIQCLASSTNDLLTSEQIVYGVNAGTYYILIDGKNGVEGSYKLSIDCADFFSVSPDTNDAYIDLSWSIDKKLCVPQDTGILIRLITTPNVILYEEEFGTAAQVPDVIRGSFRHFVGPDVSRQYVLRVFNRLTDKKICDEIESGQTISFKPPVIQSVSNLEYPDSIKIVWRNLSKLSDEFRIFRDGEQIVNLTDGYTEDSLIVTYIDIHNINDTTSLQQNQSYTYCIETFNSTLSSSYGQVCSSGSTYDIGFQASDDTLSNEISLNWNEISDFCSGILIEREGIQLIILDNEVTSYVDNNPIRGISTEYSLTLLEGNIEKMEVSDQGYVGPNGKISGRTITSGTFYPVKDVLVALVNSNTSEFIDSTRTDFNGEFMFDDLIYGLSSDFEISVNKPGTLFNSSSITVTLNNAIPSDSSTVFLDESNTNIKSDIGILDTLNADIFVNEGFVDISWDYGYSATEIVYFNLSRDGTNIFSGNDFQGKQDIFSDITGIGGEEYLYTLEAFTFDEDTIISDIRSIEVVYPSMIALNQLDVVKGDINLIAGTQNFDPRLFFNWEAAQYPNRNFEGYRLFENSSLIAEVDTSTKSFVYLANPGTSASYQIEAYRTIGEVTEESPPFPSDGLMVQSNALWEPKIAAPGTGPNDLKAITIDLDQSLDFYQSAFYDGIVLERKRITENDSLYEEIGFITKSFIQSMKLQGEPPIFWDRYGIPGTMYDYRVRTFVFIDDQKLGYADTILQRSYPDLVAPSINSKNELVGEVNLGWNDESTLSFSSNQKFIQFDGIELFRRQVDPDSMSRKVTTLPASEVSFSDFISNPVYSVFLDDTVSVEYEYSLRSFTDLGDTIIYSPFSPGMMAKPLSGSFAEPLPTNFTASSNIPGHVKLCWEWIPSRQSEFIVYRDTTPLDTLPFTARAYYDYEAPNLTEIRYHVSSFNNGVESEKVTAIGGLPGPISITGQVYNNTSKAGIESVVISFFNEENIPANIPANTYSGTMITDATGYYRFDGLPEIAGMNYIVSASGDKVDFDPDIGIYLSNQQKNATLIETNSYVADFIDYQAIQASDQIAEITAITATPNDCDMSVTISWSPDGGMYDGFQVYRGTALLAEIDPDSSFSFIDTTGFLGIQYPYGVQAFRDLPEGRVTSEMKATGAIFPNIDPVENLTATAFFDQNKMLVSWSHPCDNHDFYRIKRNELIVGTVDAGAPMMWYDTTGIPGMPYQYEVVAVKQSFISIPAVVVENFKGVGEVYNLTTTVIDTFEQSCSSSLDLLGEKENHVLIEWEYLNGAADGFEIYRDSVLIAEIDSLFLSFGDRPQFPGLQLVNENKVAYRDYSGIPGRLHNYHVLAYVERVGERYTSGIEELYLIDTVRFPEIGGVKELEVRSDPILGSVNINFEYENDVVGGFEVLRDGIILDTIIHRNLGKYEYLDNSGVPGEVYEYSIRAYVRREGQVYTSDTACRETIQYPILPTPQELSASKGDFETYIDIVWTFNTDIVVDSFFLENLTTNTTISLPGGRRKFIQTVDNEIFDKFLYRVRAYRNVNGMDIYSEWSNEDEGWAFNQMNGEEEETIVEFCNEDKDGFYVAIDGNWAASTTRSGNGITKIYRRENGGWKFFQSLEGPISGEEYGYAVTISGEKMAVGAPSASKVYTYFFDGINWRPSNVLISESSGDRFGHSLEMHENDLVVGSPRAQGTSTFESDRGEIDFFINQGGYWSFNGEINGDTREFNTLDDLKFFGFGVSLKEDVAVVGYQYFDDGIISSDDEVMFYGIYTKSTSGLWSYKDLFFAGDYPFNSSLIRDNVDISQNKAAVVLQTTNEVKIFTFENDTTIQNIFELIVPADIGETSFGSIINIEEIPSPIVPKPYVLIGAPNNAGNSNRGSAYLLTKEGNNWEALDAYIQTGEDPEDKLGTSVALSQDAMIIGITGKTSINSGASKLVNLIKQPLNVEATDGLSFDGETDETSIIWEYPSDPDIQQFIRGFNIYRDGELITPSPLQPSTLSPIDSETEQGVWDDLNGLEGKQTVYTVKAINQNIPYESSGLSDLGFRIANGKIEGSVLTALSNSAVPGVTIKAKGIVEGEIYEYSGITFSDGTYQINDVYYNHDPNVETLYEVSAELGDNLIVAKTSNIALLNSESNPVVDVVDFIDSTAYIIRGTFKRPDNNCAVAGIKVTPIVNGTPNIQNEVTTDDDGNYSVIINPFASGLSEIRLEINNFVTESGSMDTTFYGFIPETSAVFNVFDDFPQETVVDFVDTLKYPVSLKVKNTCLDPISTAKWDIRIRTLDGCFDEVYTTNSSGDLNVSLLPLNYKMTVVGSSIVSAANQQALDYFANFPVSLNLLELHQDSIRTNTREEISAMADRQFIFHVAPEIEVQGFNDFFCNTPIAVIQQNQPYTLDFNIFEVIGGNECPVNEGKIKINNPAAAGTTVDILEYDPEIQGFPDYNFIAGSPNQVAPYIYAVTFDYLSDDDDFLGRKSVGVFVEGSVRLPGSDIIVDPTAGNDFVPLPIMILRDPPGDGSSSYISGGQSINYSTTVEKELGGSGEVFVESEISAIGGSTVNATFTTGGSDTDVNTLSSEISISQTLSTSSSDSGIGESADIIVGQGLVMSYGLSYDFRVGNCDTITRTEIYSLSPDAASTTWSYTVKQIRDIIQGYRIDSIGVENGTTKVEENGKVLEKSKALEKLTTYIENWEEVLVFHQETTLPHRYICATDPSGINAFQKSQIDQWQANLCPLLGTGSGSNFKLFEEITWSDPTVNMYNAAQISIQNIADGNSPLGEWAYPDDGNIFTILNRPEVQVQFGTYGAPVENITTGGGVSITNSITNVNASTRTHKSNFYISQELSIAKTISTEFRLLNFVGIFSGIGSGVIGGSGFITTVGSVDLAFGAKTAFNFTMNNERSTAIQNSVETGYTLFDDDLTDQLNVVVIQPIAQNHTAYFDYFGGRTSCPPEEGAIFVDDPRINIIDQEAGGTKKDLDLFFLPSDEPAIVLIQVTNNTPFDGDREFEIFLDQASNENGATITINGVSLNNGTYVSSLPAQGQDTLVLSISRNSTFFEYPDLSLGISPSCGGEPQDFINITVLFANPCSPVSLTSPDNGWVINDDTTKLLITMQDYDPTNPFLEDATLEYRRTGSGMAWTDINPLELERGNFITPGALADNDTTFAAGQIRKYFFIWTIPADEGKYPDGDYELRVKMQCNNFSSTLSNVITGKIAREGVQLFGLPQPSDKLWTQGDEISFTFNKNLDCALINSSFIEENISVYDETTQEFLGFSLSCYANKLIFVLDSSMVNYDGHNLTICVNDIPSIAGNISETFCWTFRVITQKLYWANADTIKIRMYEGETLPLDVQLLNNSNNQTVNGVSLSIDDGVLDDWLEIINPDLSMPPFTFSVPASGYNVQFMIDADVPLGTYNETINVDLIESLGNTPQLHIELTVLKRPPTWVVDPGNFSRSMNLITNWRFTSQARGSMSEDVNDLISVWKGSEIRGVASIVNSGIYNAAYLTIYGRADDPVEFPLEFRIWDADEGIEYDGHPEIDISFIENIIRGSTATPEILVVNKQVDMARYLPLNDEWTGFSLNTATTDMSLAKKLNNLKTLTDGDKIVSIVSGVRKFSVYNDSTGWFNFGSENLANLNTSNGYMIYLENGPDTLRMTGAPIQSPPNINLGFGWNWIGFPFQNNESINQVLSNITNLDNSDFIKKDVPLPGEQPQFSNYDGNWDTSSLSELEPNNLYKLLITNEPGATLDWQPVNNLRSDQSTSRSLSTLSITSDASTWAPPPLQSDKLMPIIAEVVFDENVVTNTNDKIAFFQNGFIQGYGEIQYVDEYDKYAISMVPQGIDGAGAYDILYYNSTTDSIYTSKNVLMFDLEGRGDIINPYQIHIDSQPCVNTLILDADDVPLNGNYRASQMIMLDGVLNVMNNGNVILSAPMVKITDQIIVPPTATIIIEKDGCQE